MPETILTNARIVTRDAVIEGTLTLRGGRIASLVEGRSALPGAIDCEGDLLIPGLVDVHTDNLERQVLPRSNARSGHVDAQILGACREQSMRGTPWNRLCRATGVAPSKGVGEATRSARSLGVFNNTFIR